MALGSVNVPGRLTANQIMMPDGETTVSASLSHKVDAEPLTWYDLPLINGFVPDTTFSAPQYTRTPWGYVIIRSGTIRKGEGDYGITSNPFVAQLPVGYRPPIHQQAPAVVRGLQDDNTRSSAAAFIDIDTPGNIQIHVSTAVHGNAIVFPTIVFQVSG